MKFSFAKAMRQAARLTRSGRSGAATKSMQRAIGGAMAKTVAASISYVSGATSSVKSKSATKPRQRTAPGEASPLRDRGLGAVLKRLHSAQTSMSGSFRPSRQPRPSKPPVIPKGAQYLDRNHTCSDGTRDFTLFIPAKRFGGPKGLIVMLHGCTQDPNDFATGTNMNAIAQKKGLVVAYPSQTRGHNASSCWNWFSRAHQSRGAGEPAIVASLALELMREFGLDRNDVFVAGLSAGGAMAVILADTYPDVFSAAGVHSGLPRGAASNLMSAATAMRSGGKQKAGSRSGRRRTAEDGLHARRIIFHGDADNTVHPSNASQIAAGSAGERVPARVTPKSASGRDFVKTEYTLPDGTVDIELWQVEGAGHAWSGGKAGGSYTDPQGPDASAEMVRFFLTRAS